MILMRRVWMITQNDVPPFHKQIEGLLLGVGE